MEDFATWSQTLHILDFGKVCTDVAILNSFSLEWVTMQHELATCRCTEKAQLPACHLESTPGSLSTSHKARIKPPPACSAPKSLVSVADMVEASESTFQRPHLEDAGKQIRLLRIAAVTEQEQRAEDLKFAGSELECTLSVHNLDDVVGSYVAISYTWGAKECNNRTIRVDGQTIRVRHNCWYALSQMRLHDVSVLYWIDCLCIDQGAQDEKCLQVSRMSDIYANAAMVAVCLGAGGPREKCFSEQHHNLFIKDFTEAEHTHLFDWMCGLRYFKRLWTVQECELANTIHLFFGSRRMNLAEIRNDLVRYVGHRNWFELPEKNTRGSLECLVNARKRALDGGWGLPNLIFRYAGRACHDPRDKIYGLLSLAIPQTRSRMPICYGESLLTVLVSYTKIFDRLEFFRDPTDGWSLVDDFHCTLRNLQHLAKHFRIASHAFQQDFTLLMKRQLLQALHSVLNGRTEHQTSQIETDFSLYRNRGIILQCKHKVEKRFLQQVKSASFETSCDASPCDPSACPAGGFPAKGLQAEIIALGLSRSASYKSDMLKVVGDTLESANCSADQNSEPTSSFQTYMKALAQKPPDSRITKLLVIDDPYKGCHAAILQVPSETAESDMILECTGGIVPRALAPLYLVARQHGSPGYAECNIIGRAFLLHGYVPPSQPMPDPWKIVTSIATEALLLLATATADKDLLLLLSLLISHHIPSSEAVQPFMAPKRRRRRNATRYDS